MKEKTTGLIVILILLICFIMISIWSIQPVEEVLKEAMEEAEEQFYEEPIEPNVQLDHFSLFLPDSFEVIEQSQYNLLLEKNGQTFILFYNELEEQSSRLNFEEAKQGNNNSEWLESFEKDDRFGFIYVLEGNEQHEIQLGVGGVKVTTISSKANIVEDVKNMMNIANSLAY